MIKQLLTFTPKIMRYNGRMRHTRNTPNTPYEHTRLLEVVKKMQKEIKSCNTTIILTSIGTICNSTCLIYNLYTK
jgi:hypothetical protein